MFVLLGLYMFMLALYFVQRRNSKKKHRYDERYYKVTNRMKARSWDAMLIVYMFAWPIVIIFDGISFSFFLLTILYVVHCISVLITGIYYTNEK